MLSDCWVCGWLVVGNFGFLCLGFAGCGADSSCCCALGLVFCVVWDDWLYVVYCLWLWDEFRGVTSGSRCFVIWWLCVLGFSILLTLIAVPVQLVCGLCVVALGRVGYGFMLDLDC